MNVCAFRSFIVIMCDPYDFSRVSPLIDIPLSPMSLFNEFSDSEVGDSNWGLDGFLSKDFRSGAKTSCSTSSVSQTLILLALIIILFRKSFGDDSIQSGFAQISGPITP